MKNLNKTQNLSIDSNSSTNYPIDDSWRTAAGPLAIPMTNDYLFRSLLQSNNKVLKGLICSLLHLDANNIHSADILNPIELGKSVDDKTFILDIKVLFNDRTIVHLEMQVVNQHNWPDRSLSYLCRSFDQLTRGKAYQTIKPVIQIGILDFTLFPEHPEFYSTYQLLNVKNYTKYSDKLRLSVLDLTQIELAVEEDRLHQLDYWAALFKTATWEDLKMLAENNSYIAEAASTIYELSQDEKIRLQCEAREDHYRRQASVQYEIDMQNAMLEEQKTRIEEQNAAIEEQDTRIEAQNTKIEEQNTKIEEQNARIEEQNARIETLNAEKEALLAEKEVWAMEREQLLARCAGKDSSLSDLR
ncbi:MAG: Rpn family recombination-promoting nuclease/putative transposase [Lachnospiraceae bacterium]|nr:Rpn family recombination-promoting nuclease/putative transposase [Lachnospiraceae bacterium]